MSPIFPRRAPDGAHLCSGLLAIVCQSSKGVQDRLVVGHDRDCESIGGIGVCCHWPGTSRRDAVLRITASRVSASALNCPSCAAACRAVVSGVSAKTAASGSFTPTVYTGSQAKKPPERLRICEVGTVSPIDQPSSQVNLSRPLAKLLAVAVLAPVTVLAVFAGAWIYIRETRSSTALDTVVAVEWKCPIAGHTETVRGSPARGGPISPTRVAVPDTTIYVPDQVITGKKCKDSKTSTKYQEVTVRSGVGGSYVVKVDPYTAVVVGDEWPPR